MFCLSIIFHLGVELHFLLKTEVSVVVPVCSAMVVTTVDFIHSSTRNHINEVVFHHGDSCIVKPQDGTFNIYMSE